MTQLAKKLDKRIQIRQAVQTENASGGFDRSYNTLLTVWAGLRSVGYKGSEVEYVREMQVGEVPTHKFLVRQVAVSSLGKQFGNGFDNGFDSVADLALLKSGYFIFLEQGTSSKGRLFRIHAAGRAEERNEYLNILAEELEEHGTGINL